jgi:hypothetical protein
MEVDLFPVGTTLDAVVEPSLVGVPSIVVCKAKSIPPIFGAK